jgi:hypothetical protein
MGKVTNMKTLRKMLTDSRIRISKHDNVYYADVVEDNGDAFELARTITVQSLYDQLASWNFVIKSF